MTNCFWKRPLSTLGAHEWEQLCDGCAQCCRVKLQDEDTDEIFVTHIVCRYLDTHCGLCKVYPERRQLKPDCIVIDRNNAEHFSWLPKTCAYRLRYENQPLPYWHPLISGSLTAMIEAGAALRDEAVCESQIDETELSSWIVAPLEEVP